uniref:phage protein Gp27 family protein n=1 Tax=Yoonia sp. TaxID=2212373 RepID=UPI004048DBBE
MATGRGRLTAIDLMPPEADHIISWAAQALAARVETQTDIYADFTRQCEELMAQSKGELEFNIPASSSFHRYSMRQAKLTRHIDDTQAIVKAISDKFDTKGSDDLSKMLAETIKSLVFSIVASADQDSVSTKDVMQLASAFRQRGHARHQTRRYDPRLAQARRAGR